jgi:hypothetical protein
MSSNSAIGALIIVPIVIAASAAYIALKTHSVFQTIARTLCRIWEEKFPWSHRKAIERRKQKRSDLSSTQVFADSWCDLESLHSPFKVSERSYSTFIGQSPSHRSLSEGDERALLETPKRIWHPTRSDRLMWSFANPKSPNHNHFELSNVARPSPVSSHCPVPLAAETRRITHLALTILQALH